jgi:hypothetical protein
MAKAWLNYVMMAAGVTLLATSANAAPIKIPVPAPLKLPAPAPRIAGQWTIVCDVHAADCANISVTVDSAGALMDAEVPGFSGEIQGGASVDKGKLGQQILEINILDSYSFVGNLLPGGTLALGKLTIADIEHGQEVVPATAIWRP